SRATASFQFIEKALLSQGPFVANCKFLNVASTVKETRCAETRRRPAIRRTWRIRHDAQSSTRAETGVTSIYK
ncbi:MAG TPA: hypothetical protein VF778_06930, partial [Xanthobacteraceae bacterium]